MGVSFKIAVLFVIGLTVIYFATFEPRMWVKKVYSFIYVCGIFVKVVAIDIFYRVKALYTKEKKRTDIERYVYPNKNRD